MPETSVSPEFVGVFGTAFLMLLGVVVWALKQLLRHTQRYIEETIPGQQKLCQEELIAQAKVFKEHVEQVAGHFIRQSEAERDYHKRHLEIVRESWNNYQSEMVEHLKENRAAAERHAIVLERLIEEIKRR